MLEEILELITEQQIELYYLDGSNGDFAGGDYFNISAYGTTDLSFGYGAVTKMTLKSTGNVGIGTSTPQKKFHVEHTAGASEGILISGASDTVGHTAGILLRAEGGEADSALRAKAGIFLERTATYGIGKLHIANRHNSDNVSATTSDANITIYDDKVGIGTTSPSNMLSVNGVITSGNFTATSVGGTPADANTAEIGPGYINLARDDTAAARQITFGKNGAVHSYLETTSTGLNIGGANVGIGTTSPDHPLEVVGAISSADTGLQKATFANVGNDLVMTANAGATNVSSNIIFKSSQSGGAAAERMRIDSNLGNVGINTSNPYSGTGVTSMTVNAANYPVVSLKRADNNIFEIFGYYNHTTLNASVGYMQFNTDDTERMRILDNGKVAIGAGGSGTSGTHTKLEVHGAIAAGSAQGTGGSLVLYQRYGVNDMPATLSTHYSNSYWLLATGMKARSGAGGYVSSLGNYSTARAGIDVNNSSIKFLYVPAATVAVDTVVTPTTPFDMNLDTGTLMLTNGASGTSNGIVFKETNNSDLNKYIKQTAYYMQYNGHPNEGHHFTTSGSQSQLRIHGPTNGTRPSSVDVTATNGLYVNNAQRIESDGTMTASKIIAPIASTHGGFLHGGVTPNPAASYLGSNGADFGTAAIYRTPVITSSSTVIATSQFLTIYTSGHWGEYPVFKFKVYGTYYAGGYREYIGYMASTSAGLNVVETHGTARY